MRKLTIALLALLLVSTASYAAIESVINASTGNLDYIGQSPSDADDNNSLYVNILGDTMAGDLNFGGFDALGFGGLTFPNSTSLPGTCTVGQIYMDTDATSGQRIYACESTNTWVLQGGSSTGFQQLVTVAKAGGDFTSIQDAIDSITDATTTKRYTVLVHPGDYAENIVGKAYVSIVGYGGSVSSYARIRPTSGTAYTAPATGLSGLQNINIDLPVTASGAKGIVVTGGVHGFEGVRVSLSSSTNGVNGTLIDVSGGVMIFAFGQTNYALSGSSAGVATHNIINVTGGNLDYYANEGTITVTDVDDEVNYFTETVASAIPTRFFSNNTTINITNASYSGATHFYNAEGTDPNKNFFGNIIRLIGSAAASGSHAEVYHIDTSSNNGVVHSSSNRLIVTGFQDNFLAEVATGDELVSHFDDIVATEGEYGAGTYTYVNAPSEGDIQISGSYFNMYDSAYTVGVRGADFTSIQDALDAHPDQNIVIIVYPGTYAGDTINFTDNNQAVVGVGFAPLQVITATDATIVSFGAYTGCKIEQMRFEMTDPTNSLTHLLNGTAGNIEIIDSEFVLNSTTDYNNTGQPAVLAITTGQLTMKRGSITYTNASDHGPARKGAAYIGGASGRMDFDNVTMNITGTNASTFTTSVFSYFISAIINFSRCSINVTDNSTTTTMGIRHSGSGNISSNYNEITVANSTNTAIGILVEAGAGAVIANSSHSTYNVTGATAYAFKLDNANATVISHMDYIIAANGVSNSGGSYTAVNTATSGVLSITKSAYLQEQAAALGDTAGLGQIWVKNDTPNTLYFTDDAGNDLQIGSGDVSAVGDCLTGACFTGATGTTLSSNTDLIMDLDNDNNGTESFQIRDGANAIVAEVTEAGALQIDSNFTLGSAAAGVDYTITVDGETFDGVITYNEDLDGFQFDNHVGIGTPPSAFQLDVRKAFTGTGAETGLYVLPTYTPSGSTTTGHAGVSGYAQFTGTTNWADGAILYGLQFGPYCFSATAGNNQDLIGVDTWAVRGYNSTQTGDDAYGIKITTAVEDATDSFTFDNIYGLYIKDKINTPAGTMTNQYMLYIEEPTLGGTLKKQIALAGNGQADSGIWFNLTTHQLYSDGTDFYITGLTSVGTTTPDLNYVSATGKVEYESSTRRIKKDIQPYSIEGRKFLDVVPKSYNYISTGNPDIGFIAEELVEAGMTDAVGYDDEGKPAFLRKYVMIAYLLELAKEQDKRIKELEMKYENCYNSR